MYNKYKVDEIVEKNEEILRQPSWPGVNATLTMTNTSNINLISVIR